MTFPPRLLSLHSVLLYMSLGSSCMTMVLVQWFTVIYLVPRHFSRGTTVWTLQLYSRSWLVRPWSTSGVTLLPVLLWPLSTLVLSLWRAAMRATMMSVWGLHWKG